MPLYKEDAQIEEFKRNKAVFVNQKQQDRFIIEIPENKPKKRRVKSISVRAASKFETIGAHGDST